MQSSKEEAEKADHRARVATEATEQSTMLELRCDYKKLITIEKSQFQYKSWSELELAATGQIQLVSDT